MGEENQHEDLLKLLRAFTQSLAHRVRTPLSVISNDFSYFKSLIDPEECERGLRRVKEISTILDEVSAPFELNLDDEDYVLTSMAQLLSQTGIEHSGDDFSISTKTKGLLYTLEALKKMIEKAADSAKAELCESDRSLKLVLNLKHDSEAEGDFSLMTDVMFEVLGQNSTDSLVFDIFSKALGVETKINLTGDVLNLSLQFTKP